MAKQKTVSKAKEKPTTPKPGKKKRRPKVQMGRVKERGKMPAGAAGAIITLSSIRWSVSSQNVHDLWYFVTPNSRGLICRCNANAGGNMICWHVFGVHRLSEKEWWENGPRKKV